MATQSEIQLQLGLDTIRSYKRLSYSIWHALAEFIDNSTQSYFNNRAELDAQYEKSGTKLEVSIIYDRDAGYIRISDTAMGMSLDELRRALTVGMPPPNSDGRSRYGMGMKTAACWFGDTWSIRTKRLNETEEHSVTINVEAIASGNQDANYSSVSGLPLETHYTVIEIRSLHQRPHGRSIGKLKEFLRSMYRQDFRAGILTLRWQDEILTWDDGMHEFLKGKDGSTYKRNFEFDVNGKHVSGWVGVLDRGSRAKAGFAVLHSDRVVRGWPDSWRPTTIFGQLQGSNDLVNQRLVGEVVLDAFEVSQAKDNIQWMGTEEDDVEDELKKACADFVQVAKVRRKDSDERGPTNLEVETAIEELEAELNSAEMVDALTIGDVPPPEVVAGSVRPILDMAAMREEAFRAQVGSLTIKGYVVSDGSPNDPYVVTDSADLSRLVIVINFLHPHIGQLVGSEGVLNYLRHCTYDAIAEWQARNKAATIDPDTIKLLKDRLLRLAIQIEMHEGSGVAVAE